MYVEVLVTWCCVDTRCINQEVLCHRICLIFLLFQTALLQFFLFLRLIVSLLSRNQLARLLVSSPRLCWIPSKSFEDVRIIESSA